MPIDWHGYDESKTKQKRMDNSERDQVEAFVAGLLTLPVKDCSKLWGTASPPGRYAVVIHVDPEISPRYAALAHTAGVGEIGVKVYANRRDACTEAKRVLYYYPKLVPLLPDGATPHVLKFLDGGAYPDPQGVERYYLIQEWVHGRTLEDLATKPMNGAVVRSILEQLFGQLIIPLWSEGIVWWDIRPANYLWDEADRRLIQIDIDSLSAYAQERLKTPDIWDRRDHGRDTTALPRLRNMTLRLLRAQGMSAKNIKVTLDTAWPQLETVLRGLGRHSAKKDQAFAALEEFFERLCQAGLLPGP